MSIQEQYLVKYPEAILSYNDVNKYPVLIYICSKLECQSVVVSLHNNILYVQGMS